MAQQLVDFHLLLILFLVLCCRCSRSFCSISPTVSVLSLVDDMVDREILTLKQRDVMVLGKTEQAYTGVFSHGGPKYNNKEDGLYVCPLTSIPLFKSEHKFVTGSGWPSLSLDKMLHTPWRRVRTLRFTAGRKLSIRCLTLKIDN